MDQVIPLLARDQGCSPWANPDEILAFNPWHCSRRVLQDLRRHSVLCVSLPACVLPAFCRCAATDVLYYTIYINKAECNTWLDVETMFSTEIVQVWFFYVLHTFQGLSDSRLAYIKHSDTYGFQLRQKRVNE